MNISWRDLNNVHEAGDYPLTSDTGNFSISPRSPLKRKAAAGLQTATEAL